MGKRCFGCGKDTPSDEIAVSDCIIDQVTKKLRNRYWCGECCDWVDRVVDPDDEEIIWTPIWPTQPGMYWMYGDRFADGKIDMWFVRVRLVSDGSPMYVCEGAFLFNIQSGLDATGFVVFTPVVIDDIPTPEEMSRLQKLKETL